MGHIFGGMPDSTDNHFNRSIMTSNMSNFEIQAMSLLNARYPNTNPREMQE